MISPVMGQPDLVGCETQEAGAGKGGGNSDALVSTRPDAGGKSKVTWQGFLLHFRDDGDMDCFALRQIGANGNDGACELNSGRERAYPDPCPIRFLALHPAGEIGVGRLD